MSPDRLFAVATFFSIALLWSDGDCFLASAQPDFRLPAFGFRQSFLCHGPTGFPATGFWLSSVISPLSSVVPDRSGRICAVAIFFQLLFALFDLMVFIFKQSTRPGFRLPAVGHRHPSIAVPTATKLPFRPAVFFLSDTTFTYDKE